MGEGRLALFQPYPCQINRASEKEEDPVVTGHDPPPSGFVPPDVLAAEFSDAIGGVENEPEEIFDDEEDDDEADDAELAGPGPGAEAEGERRVRHQEDEDLEPDVIAGEGAVSVEDFGPAVGDSPGGERFGPAVGPFDFDFNPGESVCGSEDEERNENVVHCVEAFLDHDFQLPIGRQDICTLIGNWKLAIGNFFSIRPQNVDSRVGYSLWRRRRRRWGGPCSKRRNACGSGGRGRRVRR
jgi:hypothetical protein